MRVTTETSSGHLAPIQWRDELLCKNKSQLHNAVSQGVWIKILLLRSGRFLFFQMLVRYAPHERDNLPETV